ncbi:hypothetical protein L559_3106 [Bordetella pertussis STO1-CHOC-0017]|nr:hypothetical protein L559_3106 [Bordetella pertussis STO1-CHOC-0017]
MRAVIERAIVRAGCDGLVRPCEVAALSLWMAWLAVPPQFTQGARPDEHP